MFDSFLYLLPEMIDGVHYSMLKKNVHACTYLDAFLETRKQKIRKSS